MSLFGTSKAKKKVRPKPTITVSFLFLFYAPVLPFVAKNSRVCLLAFAYIFARVFTAIGIALAKLIIAVFAMGISLPWGV